MVNLSEIVTAAEHPAKRGLAFYAGYRILLAILFLGLFYFGFLTSFLGIHEPSRYELTAQAYILFALLMLGLMILRPFLFYRALAIQLVIDILALTALIHFSGGLSSGLGPLLVLVVVIGSLFSSGRMAFFYAALATILLFVEISYSSIVEGQANPLYYQGGMLGAMFFATALLAQVLGSRVQKSEDLMHQHASDASKMTALNQHIVDRLQVGVITVDQDGNVYSLNQSGRAMLGISDTETLSGERLATISPPLFSQFSQWRRSSGKESMHEFEANHGSTQIMPNMTPLNNGDVVIFLDDLSVLTEQAQQMKLASLGRMAASIAHEIRNPLGAISHATELLAEADNLTIDNKNLLQIIERHSGRVNGVIDAVLQLSQRKVINKQSFVLASWLDQFVGEFCQSEGMKRDKIILTISAPLAQIRFDQAQLRQIMWNLCSNAWHYSDPSPENDLPQILVRLRQVEDKIEIDVMDNGPGVSANAMPQLFEPFNTDRIGGVGLGLHLSREMAHANGGLLRYVPENNQTCFRLTISPEIEQGLT